MVGKMRLKSRAFANKIKFKIKVKGDGQECPSHTGAVSLVLFHPSGVRLSFLLFTQGLRPGLHSFAALRLGLCGWGLVYGKWWPELVNS